MSVREQSELLAVDDLDAITLPEGRLRRVIDRLLLTVVEVDGHDVIALLLHVLFDLVSREGAHPRASDRRHGVPATGADLVSDHATGDAADDCAGTRGLAFLLDEVHRLDRAAGVA